jgi:hypothetical protein
LTKTDDQWAGALEAALTASRRDNLKHGTTAAYVRGCVCSECREHQRIRMAQMAEKGLFGSEHG